MIKAIETRYKGYRFRSRLEARWAVFLDHYGITWQYEAEGYKTSAGWYLPDFRVAPESVDHTYGWPTFGEVFLEVKGAPLRPDEAERLRAFACDPGEPRWVLALGQIPDPLECLHSISGWGRGGATISHWGDASIVIEAPYNNHSNWGPTKPHFMDYAFRLHGCGPSGTTGSRMNLALTAARAARFEHGERG